ncbi:MAG: hypothetical protein AB7W47_16565 [Calditrichaceae bacterium]
MEATENKLEKMYHLASRDAEFLNLLIKSPDEALRHRELGFSVDDIPKVKNLLNEKRPTSFMQILRLTRDLLDPKPPGPRPPDPWEPWPDWRKIHETGKM